MNAGTRRAVWRRAGSRCEYCRIQQADDFLPFHIDHIRSLKHGGTDALDNLALACMDCNAHKGTDLSAIDPETGALVPIFDPRRQPWTQHFRWQGVTVQGVTPSGRATAALLRINDPPRLALRRSLQAEGRFPPPPE